MLGLANTPHSPMPYQYGEIFERLGAPGMGRLGALWCALNPDGILVLMAHANCVHIRPDKTWYYEVNAQIETSTRAASAIQSLKMIQKYYEPGRSVLLPVAEFAKDGGIGVDGRFESSEFKHATGAVYRAKFVDFKYETGYVLCDIDSKFEV